MTRPSRFSPEVRERAVRIVVAQAEKHASQWAVITSIAEKIGCTVETLRNWVRQAERDAGQRAGLTTGALRPLSRWCIGASQRSRRAGSVDSVYGASG